MLLLLALPGTKAEQYQFITMKVSKVNKNKILFNVNNSAENKPSYFTKLFLKSVVNILSLSHVRARSLKWLISQTQVYLVDTGVIQGIYLIISIFQMKHCKFMPSFCFSLALVVLVLFHARSCFSSCDLLSSNPTKNVKNCEQSKRFFFARLLLYVICTAVAGRKPRYGLHEHSTN